MCLDRSMKVQFDAAIVLRVPSAIHWLRKRASIASSAQKMTVRSLAKADLLQGHWYQCIAIWKGAATTVKIALWYRYAPKTDNGKGHWYPYVAPTKDDVTPASMVSGSPSTPLFDAGRCGLFIMRNGGVDLSSPYAKGKSDPATFLSPRVKHEWKKTRKERGKERVRFHALSRRLVLNLSCHPSPNSYQVGYPGWVGVLIANPNHCPEIDQYMYNNGILYIISVITSAKNVMRTCVPEVILMAWISNAIHSVLWLGCHYLSMPLISASDTHVLLCSNQTWASCQIRKIADCACRERFPRHRRWEIPTRITARALHTCRNACRDL